MMHRILLAALGLGLNLSAQQVPSPARLLVDLNSTSVLPASSNPAEFTAVGGSVFFVADDGTHGVELFRTLGTAGTTALVADLWPGPDGSTPRNLTALGDRLVFFADDGQHGLEPWVSDGTAGGTRLIADLVPGPVGVFLGQRIAFEGRVVFDAAVPGLGWEPWTTDGTTAGTFVLADTVPGGGSGRTPTAAALLASHTVGSSRELVFTASSGGGLEFWVSDGTPAGTRRSGFALTTPVSVLGDPVDLPNGALVFTAFPGSRSGITDLWRFDGTVAGSMLLADTLDLGAFLVRPARFGDEAWVSSGAQDGAVVRTDGTVAGTHKLLVPNVPAQPTPRFLGECAGALWAMAAETGTVSGLYRADPVARDFVRTATLPFVFDGGLRTRAPVAACLGSRFVLLGRGATVGLRTLDPVLGTTQLLAATNPVAAPGVLAQLGRVYFAMDSAVAGVEPAVSDGTPLGTVLLRDVRPGTVNAPSQGSSPTGFTPVGRRTGFRATLGDGDAIILSDGTAAGTQPLVRGLLRTADDLTVSGRQLFFSAVTPALGRELWVSDGTAANTHLVADLSPGDDSGVMAAPVGLGDRVVFLGRDAVGDGLFVSDGQTINLLRHLASGGVNAVGARFGDRVVLRVRTANFSLVELWISDGTVAGTSKLADLGNSSTADTAPFAVHRDRLWFVAAVAGQGYQLFSSDGTVAGTAPFGTLVPFSGGSTVTWVVATGGRLWVAGSAGIWYLDDLAGGVHAADLPPGTRPIVNMAPPAALGDRLLFDALTQLGFRVMATDGTRGGSVELTGLRRGIYLDQGFATLGTRHALFGIDTGAPAARALWITDGTVAGTGPFQTIDVAMTDRGERDVMVPRVVNGTLFLAARDPVLGEEPFVIDPGAITEAVGEPCGSGTRAAQLTPRNDPVLGARFHLLGTAAQGAIAIPLLSGAPLSATPFPAGGVCALEVDASFVALDVRAIGAGVFTVAFDVPDVAAIRGLQVVVQAAVGPTDAALGFDLTGGVLLTLGR